jgi:flagellar biosynthesis protein FlhB
MSMERTEQPTNRRLTEARRKGEPVGRSHELAQAATLVTGLAVLSASLPGMGDRLATSFRESISAAAETHPATGMLLDRLGAGVSLVPGLLLPLFVSVAIAGIAANLLSGGLVFSFGAIRFSGSRLNPFTGVKRLVSRDAGVRLLVNLGKLSALAIAAWLTVVGAVPRLIEMTGSPAISIINVAGGAMTSLAIVLGILTVAVAASDWLWSHRRAKKNLMMTRAEVRREAKDDEGSPEMRMRRRRRARELAFSRMMAAVPTADVVVVNPTRIAVALKYDSLTMRAPRIVAKGQRLMAARIREIAAENNIPIVEDVMLARALVVRPLDSEVPPHLYRAVAQILVIVQQARFALHGRGFGPQPVVVRAPALPAGPVATRPSTPTPQPWSPA